MRKKHNNKNLEKILFRERLILNFMWDVEVEMRDKGFTEDDIVNGMDISKKRIRRVINGYNWKLSTLLDAFAVIYYIRGYDRNVSAYLKIVKGR